MRVRGEGLILEARGQRPGDPEENRIQVVIGDHTLEEFLDMKWKRFAVVMALAVAALVVSVGQADAGYTYSTSITIDSIAGTTGTITNSPGVGALFVSTAGTSIGLQDILTPGTFLPTTPLSANFANVGVATTSASPDSFTVSYSDVITVTNPTPGGPTGSVTITGVLTLSNIQDVGGSFGGLISNLYNPPFSGGPVTIGPNVFSGFIGTGAVDDFFGPPTIGSELGTTPSGSLGGQIIPGPVPEPSSVAMLGLGVLGIGSLSFRRRSRNV